MAKSKRRRRSPGEGGVFEYTLTDGTVRFGIKFVVPQGDGTSKSVLRRRDPNGKPWTTRTAANAAIRDALSKVERGEFVEPSKQTLGEFLDEWVDGLRLAPSTVASYRKNIRLHIKPYLGGVLLTGLSSGRIKKLYRQLEEGGRRDHKGALTGQPLAKRTVRYIATILRAALQEAVDGEPARLVRNPADKADPPTVKESRAPEMHPWSDGQLRAFLGWSRVRSVLHVAWLVLAMTGMRRGELLALRWHDVDLDAGTVSVRRSAGLVKVKGEKARLIEGPTKSCKARVIELDAATVAALRTHRRDRGRLALQLGRNDALVFGDHEGGWRHPDRFSRSFKDALRHCQTALTGHADAEVPDEIKLHDLRHTHATILLRAGVHPKVVSERLGHASVSITLDIYSHVLPTIQREAVAKLAAIMGGTG